MPLDKVKRQAYLKKYREHSKEEKKTYNKKYHEVNLLAIRAQQREYHEANKEKRLAKAKEYREGNKDLFKIRKKADYLKHHEARKSHNRDYHMANRLTKNAARRVYGLKQYGLTEADFNRMADQQGFVCAVCREIIEDSNGKGKTLHVDHNHSTNRVRELLCGPCNLALGNLRERPDLCYKLASYIMWHEELTRVAA